MGASFPSSRNVRRNVDQASNEQVVQFQNQPQVVNVQNQPQVNLHIQQVNVHNQQVSSPHQQAIGLGRYTPQQLHDLIMGNMEPDLAFRRIPSTVSALPTMLQTCTIRNDVNLKKSSLELIQCQLNATRYYLRFIIDAATPCFVQIFFLAKEHVNENLSTIRIEPSLKYSKTPKKWIAKALNQVFDQSHYDDIPFMEIHRGTLQEWLYEKGSQEFPVVIHLEAAVSEMVNQEPKSPKETKKSRKKEMRTSKSQTTFATITVKLDDSFGIAILKQKIQVGGHSYELQEIYGSDHSPVRDATSSFPKEEESTWNSMENNSSDCVICMSEPRDTTILPCRHMCLCSQCANTLRKQSKKCPICRSDVESLLCINNIQK